MIGYQKLPPVVVGIHTPLTYNNTKSFISKVHGLLYSKFFYKWLIRRTKGIHVSNIFAKDYFDKKCPIEDYDRIVFEHHKKNKDIFLNNLTEKCDIQMGYFALSDAIGHLSFGIKSKMRIVYEELDALAGEAAKFHTEGMLILSDHGMKSVGRFGDHSPNGFWSFSSALNSSGESSLLIEQLFSVFRKTWKTPD